MTNDSHHRCSTHGAAERAVPLVRRLLRTRPKMPAPDRAPKPRQRQSRDRWKDVEFERDADDVTPPDHSSSKENFNPDILFPKNKFPKTYSQTSPVFQSNITRNVFKQPSFQCKPDPDTGYCTLQNSTDMWHVVFLGTDLYAPSRGVSPIFDLASKVTLPASTVLLPYDDGYYSSLTDRNLELWKLRHQRAGSYTDHLFG